MDCVGTRIIVTNDNKLGRITLLRFEDFFLKIYPNTVFFHYHPIIMICK